MSFANLTISARDMIGGAAISFVGITRPQNVQKSVRKKQKVTSEKLERLLLQKVPIRTIRALLKLMVISRYGLAIKHLYYIIKSIILIYHYLFCLVESKISCPGGYFLGIGCTGSGTCCIAKYNPGCNKGCQKDICIRAGGIWIIKDYCCNPFTCEMGN